MLNTDPAAHARFSLRQVPPARPVADLAQDARDGLIERPRSLPPKYFYDDRGSRLFDAICDTPEYYPTRTENALLERYAAQIMAAADPEHIIEFGSGTSRKTLHLLEACAAEACYWPFDVCESMLRESGSALVESYDWLQVNALVGDYLGGLARLPRPEGKRLLVFLGGTIGNFEPGQAHEFLCEVRESMEPGDTLLLGADRVKDPHILHAAYNDAAGITAEFNLNLLRVLNRELEADFDLGGFRHQARYNRALEQIEMYLVARRAQQVRLGALDADLEFANGEAILTEISRKFTPASLESLLGAAGLVVDRHFEPPNGYFSLVLARPSDAPVRPV
ncbi:MAG: L-histidine N(alpha)-methyltransferase [Gammaproteobacteria bacterium]|jgi:L-histidine Nalpha-methyltransferase